MFFKEGDAKKKKVETDLEIMLEKLARIMAEPIEPLPLDFLRKIQKMSAYGISLQALLRMFYGNCNMNFSMY